MQNRYAGDVGDFATYGLLRALCGRDLSLGVVWYLAPDENHNSDGKHVAYLQPRNERLYRPCDVRLYDALGGIVRSGLRCVGAIERAGVLPVARFFSEPLVFDGARTPAGRGEHRSGWIARALAATAGCDVVFLDPDNGLAPAAVDPHARSAPKYAFCNELSPFVEGGQTVVLYQHLVRSAPAAEQARRRLAELEERLRPPAGVVALRFRRGSGRFFFILPQPRHSGVIRERLNRFLAGPWSRHFTNASDQLDRRARA